jgi:hypothetical protein
VARSHKKAPGSPGCIWMYLDFLCLPQVSQP